MSYISGRASRNGWLFFSSGPRVVVYFQVICTRIGARNQAQLIHAVSNYELFAYQRSQTLISICFLKEHVSIRIYCQLFHIGIGRCQNICSMRCTNINIGWRRAKEVCL